MQSVFVRAETFPNEYRTPLVPEDVKFLVQSGITVYVESSLTRVFSDKLYKDISGCIVTEHSWNHPEYQTSFILGIKELTNLQDLSGHRHAYFSHCLKGQAGSEPILNAFRRSKSLLYDFEYFTDGSGIRCIAFGWYAGVVGAALGLQEYERRLLGQPSLQDLQPWSSFESLLDSIPVVGHPRIAVLGANGRCGQGVCSVLKNLGLAYTPFLKETKIAQLEAFEVVYNCIQLEESYAEVWFSERTQIHHPIVLVDISCDYSKPNNPISFYSEPTNWIYPVFHPHPLVSVIAIENLPSLLPQESSSHFSRCLTELLLEYPNETWNRSFTVFNLKSQAEKK
jgi:saccharopine dehydrogenase (NAD+, L-lysine-forming)